MVSNQKRLFNQLLQDITFHHETRVEKYKLLNRKDQSMALLHLSHHTLHDLLSKISNEDLIVALEYLDPDEITDILQTVEKGRQKKILQLLSERLRKEVQILFEFDPNTAAGIMSLDYILIQENESITSVSKKFKVHEKRTGRLPVIIVLKDSRLSGYLPGHELGFGQANESVKKYIRRIPGIKHNTSKDRVIDIFKTHQHNKVAVLGEHENVIGIIYSDDVLRLLEEQESASLYDFAGVRDEESVSDTTRTKVLSRYKWLIINLATAFLAAFTVGVFDKTISKYVLLAVYMPIVAGMGGNAATQTLAVLVRGIALKQINLQSSLPTLRREVSAGIINGVINGIIVTVVVTLFNKDLKIAIVLGLAMIVNLMVAGFFGTLVPLVMERLGKDPATSATIFITTATDVLGFIAFLGLATLLLE